MESLPWYKQFWPWFIFGLPASVVVAGLTTLAIAIEHRDSLVVDDYYKEGLAINRYLAEDDVAERLHLQAELDLALHGGDISVTLHGKTDQLPRTVELKWVHPISSDKDFSVTLTREAGGRYSGHLSTKPGGRWHLQLSGMQPQPWRLRREFNFNDGHHFEF